MRPTSTLTPERVLAAARDTASVITDAQVEQLVQAVAWAGLHPGEEPDPEVEWAMRPLELAGDGAPLVDESAVAEFALAVGLKHEPGARLIGDAVELCHRLPRLWGRVCAGEVAVWKARKIADATRSLSLAAAGAVDRHLALVAKRCSFAEIERQVERARAEYDPLEAERRRAQAAEQRHFDFHFRAVTSDGMVPFTGVASLADALAADAWIAAKAAALDPAIAWDVRRSLALGLLGAGETDDPAQRQLVLYTHARPGQAMVEVENTRTVVTPDQVKEWCQQAGTRVTVRPVLDLAAELSAGGHDPTPIMREQAWARYPTCVFPDCERPSRGCDLDHRTPWPAGPTTTSNLYPLCRTHHRLKTTGGWTYHPLNPAASASAASTIEWTSPMGYRYLRHTH
ncbi:HNH endonuclease signature motif containing protein [Nocardioides hungaricus]